VTRVPKGEQLVLRASDLEAPEPDAPPRAKVLIVDDDERNAFAACQAQEELGHELIVARSGEEALRHLLFEDIALILLDLHMPGMDGYETAALIRARRRTARIPIVFLTAVFRDEAHLFQAYSAGAVDVVFKPVDPFILRSKVSVLVDLHLKNQEIQRQSEHRRRLLEENFQVRREKLSAERALRQTQERQQAIMASLPIVFTARALEPPYAPLFVSESVKGLTGFAAERFVAEPGFGTSRIHPEDMDGLVQAISQARSTGAYACEFRWKCVDGQYRTFLDQGVVAPEIDGEPAQIFGTLLDVTEKRSLEEQLAQARKMEAVGQLTGGIAHDFNNLLTVVLGNVDLLARSAGEDERMQRQLSAVRHAAQRGRSLTRQLLAFSRRQHLSPVTLDVNDLVRNFAPLLRQAVGEPVELELQLGEEPLCVHVDPSQLETALLNLAVNARDAMPDGGSLTVSTHMAALDEAGLAGNPALRGKPWAVIEVRDTGQGMTREVAERVFEPFFTTKDVGKGSGLGLSQVYGFVHQSGGQVNVDTRPLEGAAFQLYLPTSDQPIAPRQQAEEKPAEPVGGVERILVVEDDPGVLALTIEMLSGLGYNVLTASNAAQALRHLNSDEPIDLLFTDVVMPGGMNGVHLARAAREKRPGIRILLTSGFPGTTVNDHELPLLDKPYAPSTLAAVLRELLADETLPPVRAGGGASGGKPGPGRRPRQATAS
jgi:signal transduction histidine kinase